MAFTNPYAGTLDPGIWASAPISGGALANLPTNAALRSTNTNFTQYTSAANLKGLPVGGFKVEPSVKRTRYMPTYVNESAVAAGGTVELQLGNVLDIVDLNATTPIALADWTITTPDGDTVDAMMLTRIASAPMVQIQELPPGKYTFTNVSGGALNLILGIHQVQADEI